MKRLLLGLFLTFLLFTPLFAQDATIQKISGKVELKAPGGVWATAAEGQRIAKGATISTSFGASAVLNLGSSVIDVKQLTRMTLEELVQQQGTQTTAVKLDIGSIKAKVQTAAGISHDFTLRTSTSTAAVRGTEFSFDGFSLEVSEGTVALTTAAGRMELVSAGQINGGELARVAGFTVVPAGTGESGAGEENTGTVVVTWN